MTPELINLMECGCPVQTGISSYIPRNNYIFNNEYNRPKQEDTGEAT